MAGFDQAIEKLNKLNKDLQEKSERDRKVAELQAMATAWLALMPAPDTADAKWLAADRVRTLVKELTSS